MKASVDSNLCIGCGICEQICDTVFEMTGIMDGAGFGNFRYHQTLFQTLENPDAPEPVVEGFGRGGFVVVSGRRP